MGSHERFEELRYELLKEFQGFNSAFDITRDFTQKFMRLVELCTFSLMNEEENFFALFMIQMKRSIKIDLPSATGVSATISHFTIHFNPAIFLNCSLEEMKALIKHEIYHIMSSHLKRAAALRKRYSALAVNKAMDVSINQYIKKLPSFMDTLQSVKLSYNVNLKPESTLEEYARILQEAINRLRKDKGTETFEADKKDEIETMHDPAHTHDIWDMSEDSFNFEQLEELTKKTANNSKRGKTPLGLGPLLKSLNEIPEISWYRYLKNLMGAMPSGYKKTITRKDRRQPDRLDLRGRLSDHVSKIAVAIDISGSMTDVEIEQAMVEIMTIAKAAAGEITVIECDSEVRRVYKAKSKNDIKQKLNTKGSTKFSPVFKYMRDNGMRNHLLIYFTDGLGEEELNIVPSNYKTLWVLTGKGENISLRIPYGEVKRLSNVKAPEKDAGYFKNAMQNLPDGWHK